MNITNLHPAVPKIRYGLDTNGNGNTSGARMTTTKTLGSATKFTISFWMKIQTSITINKRVMGTGTGDFSTGDYLNVMCDNTTIFVSARVSTTVRGHSFTVSSMNDSNWHHIFIQVDTSQAVNTDRVKVWLDNVAQTSATVGTGYFTLSQSLPVVNWEMFRYTDSGGTGRFIDAFFADIYLLDGLTVDKARFVMTTSGGKKPVDYGGPYGTEGFKLECGNSANFGVDTAGNGDWTEDEFSASFVQVTSPPG